MPSGAFIRTSTLALEVGVGLVVVFQSVSGAWTGAPSEPKATAKIKAAEAAMVSELREKAASLAIASAAEIITAKLDDKAGMGLIDDAAKEIEKLN